MTDTPSTSRSDAELLASMQASAHDELLFFSNNGKADRDCWVVSRFLRCRSLDFLETELSYPDQHNKTDVQFRDANFQLKEILNPGTKRGDEIKGNYNRLKAATKLEDIIGPPFSYDVPAPTTIYALVSGQAAHLALDQKYGSSKHELDLLFYVTRTNASPIRNEEINADALSLHGWRSISCLTGNQATVLFAGVNAPSFLRANNDG